MRAATQGPFQAGSVELAAHGDRGEGDGLRDDVREESTLEAEALPTANLIRACVSAALASARHRCPWRHRRRAPTGRHGCGRRGLVRPGRSITGGIALHKKRHLTLATWLWAILVRSQLTLESLDFLLALRHRSGQPVVELSL